MPECCNIPRRKEQKQTSFSCYIIQLELLNFSKNTTLKPQRIQTLTEQAFDALRPSFNLQANIKTNECQSVAIYLVEKSKNKQVFHVISLPDCHYSDFSTFKKYSF